MRKRGRPAQIARQPDGLLQVGAAQIRFTEIGSVQINAHEMQGLHLAATMVGVPSLAALHDLEACILISGQRVVVAVLRLEFCEHLNR